MKQVHIHAPGDCVPTTQSVKIGQAMCLRRRPDMAHNALNCREDAAKLLSGEPNA